MREKPLVFTRNCLFEYYGRTLVIFNITPTKNKKKMKYPVEFYLGYFPQFFFSFRSLYLFFVTYEIMQYKMNILFLRDKNGMG